MKIKEVTRSGKKYIYAFSDTGKILTYRRKTKKFTLTDAKKKFKRDKTLKENVVITPRVDFNEVSTTNIRVKLKSKVKRLVRATAFITVNKKRTVLYGSSTYKTQEEASINQLKEEATVSVYEKIGEEFTGDYDEAAGKKVAENKKVNVELKYEVVYFKKK